jgi:hypothetical protein
MTRAQLDYTRGSTALSSAPSIETPVEGYYRAKLRSGGAYVGVRIWNGPPRDPLTGEELDRSWRWQAEVNGEVVDIDDAWPRLAHENITAADYAVHCRQQGWAREHAPDSALANPRRRHDPLTTSINYF